VLSDAAPRPPARLVRPSGPISTPGGPRAEREPPARGVHPGANVGYLMISAPCLCKLGRVLSCCRTEIGNESTAQLDGLGRGGSRPGCTWSQQPLAVCRRRSARRHWPAATPSSGPQRDTGRVAPQVHAARFGCGGAPGRSWAGPRFLRRIGVNVYLCHASPSPSLVCLREWLPRMAREWWLAAVATGPGISRQIRAWATAGRRVDRGS